jgi:hypothetical protein
MKKLIKTYALLLMFSVVFYSCKTTNTQFDIERIEAINYKKHIKINEIEITNIPSKFHGNWVGSMGIKMLDHGPRQPEIIEADDGSMIPLGYLIGPNGELTPFDESPLKDMPLSNAVLFNISENQISEYILAFIDNLVICNWDENASERMYREIKPEKEYYICNGNNITYAWIHKGLLKNKYFTETQIYSFSIYNKDTLFLVWTSHINFTDDSNINEVLYRSEYFYFFKTEKFRPDDEYKDEKKIVNGRISSKERIASSFYGDWVGDIKNEKDEILKRINILINNGTLAFYESDKGGNFIQIEDNNFSYIFNGNNLIITIIYNKYFTENYSFSLAERNELHSLFSRNYNENSNNTNNIVKYSLGSGCLEKKLL